MLETSPVLHPQILSALASAGHLAQVLITDGNYPHSSKPNPRALVVWANFVPGVLDAVSVLRMVADLVPIERVNVMSPERTGAYAMPGDPPIWAAFQQVLQQHGEFRSELTRLSKPEFNAAARGEDVVLVIATAETQRFANVLVTIGVADRVRADASPG